MRINKILASIKHRLTPVILAVWEAKIGRISVSGQSGEIENEIVHETPISKIT
jgi:hypothetical protein